MEQRADVCSWPFYARLSPLYRAPLWLVSHSPLICEGCVSECALGQAFDGPSRALLRRAGVLGPFFLLFLVQFSSALSVVLCFVILVLHVCFFFFTLFSFVRSMFLLLSRAFPATSDVACVCVLYVSAYVVALRTDASSSPLFWTQFLSVCPCDNVCGSVIEACHTRLCLCVCASSFCETTSVLIGISRDGFEEVLFFSFWL